MADTGVDEEGAWVGDLPSALAPEIILRLHARPIALFLDYDGTLTPIVDDPAQATLPPEAFQTLTRVAERYPVAVISGRDVADVRRMVGVEGIHYAGSHGFDIAAPSGRRLEHPPGRSRLAALDRAERELNQEVRAIPGAQVERKRFAIAVHYRRVDDDRLPSLERAVVRTAARHPGLRTSGGKKVWELRPDVDWDKGKAVLWLLQALGLDRDATMPIYIGDDVTDEDAFAAIRYRGLGIVVGAGNRRTAAGAALRDPAEVTAFLDHLGRRALGTETPR
ncbi:MAG TPA: trehalose-phosphatase [Acidimicrobiales bacterium]|nr:trehalose-phosphatase [Acidimicrobiales bacterium]